MRCLAIAGAFLTFVMVPQIGPADAAAKQPTRYCLMARGGGENCGFFSMQQCQQAAAGSGGMCVVAAMQDVRPKGKLPPVKDLSPRDEDDTEN